MNKNKKGRTWAFVVYPESLPKNWKEIITNISIPLALSPLHDKDINPDGTIKKPHYHCIIYYDNPTTFNNVKQNICDLLNGTIPIKLESVRGMYRYHLHLDNPEKHQYDDRDRQFFNGFDKEQIEGLTKTEIIKLKKELINFIIDNNINEYCVLISMLLKNDCNDLFKVASENTLFFTAFLTSQRYNLS